MPRNSINCYLIGDVLIDAGIKGSHKKIMRALEGRTVSAHALTHAHGDHQGSSASICKALNIPFWVSEGEKEIAESGDVSRDTPNPNHWILSYQDKRWAGPGHPVDRILKEGDEIAGFKVVDSPGHSRGHISFFREEDGVLIVGDTMVNMNLITTIPGLSKPPRIFTTDPDQNVESIKKLASLKPKIICFGHGPVLTDPQKLERFVRKL